MKLGLTIVVDVPLSGSCIHQPLAMGHDLAAEVGLLPWHCLRSWAHGEDFEYGQSVGMLAAPKTPSLAIEFMAAIPPFET